MEPIFIVGATGKVGRSVVARLASNGASIVAIGRTKATLIELPAAEYRIGDLDDTALMARALAGGRIVVSCAHARFVPALLAALPKNLERLVALGSTRKFTRFPDAASEAVRAGETALTASGVPSVMLHPTMIYGASGENNVQRIAAYIRRLGIVPLPNGGRALIQPIHVDDVVACVIAAIERPEALGAPIVIAGPRAMPYREFVAAIGRAIRRDVGIFSVPASLLILAAAMTRALPGLPRVTANEVRRLLEDKAFDIADMQHRLGVEPMSLERGLELTFGT